MRSRPTRICCSGVAAQAQQVAAAGETQAASEYQTEANLYGESEIGDWISGAISGVAGVAELAGRRWARPTCAGSHSGRCGGSADRYPVNYLN
jgi:hypothetical protein